MLTSETVLLVMPTGQDATLARATLYEHGIVAETRDHVGEVSTLDIVEGGALVVAEEALLHPATPPFLKRLLDQPPWSELPLLAMMSRADLMQSHFLTDIQRRVNLTILERPLRRLTFISAVRAALRGRHRQYQVRRLLERMQAELEQRQFAEAEILRLLKEAEAREEHLRSQQAQLVQAAKLATVGELATGVAHELNNPLNNIALLLGNMRDSIAANSYGPSALVQSLTLASSQVDKAAAIVRHLRTFGRKAGAEKMPVSLNGIIRSALELVEGQFRQGNIELVLQLSRVEPYVLGNAIQLEQVILNLLTNARDAVEGMLTKRITISTCVVGDQVHAQIRDTGIGIPEDQQSRIFDPFFTTKPVGQGTGLGLSIAYGIVEEHNGHIAVSSVKDEGTVVDLRFSLIPHE